MVALDFILPVYTGRAQLDGQAGAPILEGTFPRDPHCAGTAGAGGALGSWGDFQIPPKGMRRQICELAGGGGRLGIPPPAFGSSGHHQAAHAGP